MLFAMNKTINKSQGSAFLLLKTDILLLDTII